MPSYTPNTCKYSIFDEKKTNDRLFTGIILKDQNIFYIIKNTYLVNHSVIYDFQSVNLSIDLKYIYIVILCFHGLHF